MSVCEIETAETYEKGRPKRGGLSDPRMGTMDRAMKCETDGMSSTDTPGYFGHLELAKPVFHHGFIKNVVSVLRCVGFSSSKLMIDKVRSDERDATSEAIFSLPFSPRDTSATPARARATRRARSPASERAIDARWFPRRNAARSGRGATLRRARSSDPTPPLSGRKNRAAGSFTHARPTLQPTLTELENLRR